jgi:hypothetical protein
MSDMVLIGRHKTKLGRIALRLRFDPATAAAAATATAAVASP